MNERVDQGLHWWRSSYCADNACVEVARDGDVVLIRNSERPDDIIRCTTSGWTAFLAEIKAGDIPVR
jgi:hypothetical protein